MTDEQTEQLMQTVQALSAEVTELRKEKSEDLTPDLIQDLRDEIADLKSNPSTGEGGGGKELAELRKSVLELTKKVGKMPSLRKQRKQYEKGVEKKGPTRFLRTTQRTVDGKGKVTTKVVKFEVTA